MPCVCPRPTDARPRTARHELLLPLIAALLILAAACSNDDPVPTVTAVPTATRTQTPTPSPTPLPTATPRPRPEAVAFPEDLQAEARQLLERIAVARNSPPMRSVDMFLLTRDQVRAIYAQEGTPGSDPSATPDPASPSPADLKQETYVLLGLIPPPEEAGGRDLAAQQLDDLIPLITGFYSSEFNAFYLVSGLSGGIYGGLARSTIVHELTHALQYQYQDIDAIARQRANDWDGMTALLQVLEGDAVNTENLVLGFSTRSTYRQPVCFTIPPPQRRDSPFVVERELDTWYEDGLCFIQAVSGRVLRGIAGIFEDLPTTTEQILHPEKYLAGEDAEPVILPALDPVLGSGWRLWGRANFGEFGLQNLLLLGVLGDRPLVQAAAAGWGGDSLALYGNGDARLLHAEIVWDTPEDAREFFDALITSLANRGSDRQPPFGADRYELQLGAATWHAYVVGSRVALLVGTDARAFAAAKDTVIRP